MQPRAVALLAQAAGWVLLACGSTSRDHGGTGGAAAVGGGPSGGGATDTATGGGVGTSGGAGFAPLQVGDRCGIAAECEPELVCFGRFFFERHVCTRTCDGSADCPEGTECAAAVPDYDGMLVGPYCLKPCQYASDCNGSDCDTHEPLTGSYCF